VSAVVPQVADELLSQAVAAQHASAQRHGLSAHFVEHVPLGDENFDVALAVIPAGAFFMGSPRKEFAHQESEGPQHKVSVQHDFALMRHCVTLGDYERFCVATGYPRPRRYSWTDARFPVFNVCFVDADAYAVWLSEQTGQCYRLPTEAEWEYAARAGTETAFAFGEKIHRSEVNCSGGLHCARVFIFVAESPGHGRSFACQCLGAA